MTNLIESPTYEFKNVDCTTVAHLNLVRFESDRIPARVLGTGAGFGFNPASHHMRLSDRTRLKDWEMIEGLKFRVQEAPDYEAFDSTASNLLEAGTPFLAKVDLPTLGYTNSHYHYTSRLHVINIYGERPHQYFVVDPLHKFSGWLAKHIVIEAYLHSGISGHSLSYFDGQNFKWESRRAKIFHLLSLNTSLMLGQKIEGGYVYGLDGMQVLRDFLLETQNFEQNDFKSISLEWVKMCHNVAKSRYWLGEMISEEELFSKTLEADMIEKTRILYEAWKVAGFMSLKGAKKGTWAKMVERIVTKVNTLIKIESQLSVLLTNNLPNQANVKNQNYDG